MKRLDVNEDEDEDDDEDGLGTAEEVGGGAHACSRIHIHMLT